jgi:hypothetical protein
VRRRSGAGTAGRGHSRPHESRSGGGRIETEAVVSLRRGRRRRRRRRLP